MIRVTNEVVTIDFAGRPVRGLLNGTIEGWSFQSDDHYFLELFPAGVVYSFSHYGPHLLFSQMIFQEDLARTMKRLIVERCFLSTNDSSD